MEKLPKYMDIVQWAKSQIESPAFSAGDRFFSEKELGRRFDLSRPTVRHALDVLEADGYIERIRGSGTYVCYEQRSPLTKTMNIGMISTYLDDYIFPSIIRGIEQVLTEHGYTIQFAFTHNQIANESRALQNMIEKQVDGLIVEPTKSGLPSLNLDLYRQVQNAGIPLVFFNAYYPSIPAPYVAMDDEATGYLATRYLINAGHSRIGGIFLLNDLQGHLRYLGYIKALSEAGIPPRDEQVLWYATEDLNDSACKPEMLLPRLDNCTAVFCYNDQLAIRIIEALKRSGRRVPGDISVMGVDNCDMSGICDPALTTISHPSQDLGRTTAHRLLAMIEGGPAKSHLFSPVIIERNSVALRME